MVQEITCLEVRLWQNATTACFIDFLGEEDMKIRGKNRTSNRSGFSLLELLAVVTILAIIAVVVIPRISASSAAAKQKVDAQNKADINLAVERWYFENGAWPADNLSDIGADKAYFPSGMPTNPTSGGTYTLDSATHRVN